MNWISDTWLLLERKKKKMKKLKKELGKNWKKKIVCVKCHAKSELRQMPCTKSASTAVQKVNCVKSHPALKLCVSEVKSHPISLINKVPESKFFWTKAFCVKRPPPHKSISFVWIVWSTLYVYLWKVRKLFNGRNYLRKY